MAGIVRAVVIALVVVVIVSILVMFETSYVNVEPRAS